MSDIALTPSEFAGFIQLAAQINDTSYDGQCNPLFEGGPEDYAYLHGAYVSDTPDGPAVFEALVQKGLFYPAFHDKYADGDGMCAPITPAGVQLAKDYYRAIKAAEILI